MGNRLSVTIISSLAADGEGASQTISAASDPILAPPPPIWEQPPQPQPRIDILPEPVSAEVGPISENLVPFEEPAPIETPPVEPEPEIKKPAPAPRLIVPNKKPLPVKEAKPPAEKYVQAKQEVLEFEPVTRGRFEKSEPTIVEGHDLDVPTFLRKNIRVK
jgi:cell division protein FtsZ